ncbi:hypothetical protein GS531_04915 [Rhodococcus hoagii]|nr:hypothetical protein [Prescottella equi]
MAELLRGRSVAENFDPEPRLLPLPRITRRRRRLGLGGFGAAPGHGSPTPAFIWPADHAWCVTCDVDPHFASIGASADAIARLVADTRVDVVVDDPDTEPPYYG